MLVVETIAKIRLDHLVRGVPIEGHVLACKWAVYWAPWIVESSYALPVAQPR